MEDLSSSPQGLLRASPVFICLPEGCSCRGQIRPWGSRVPNDIPPTIKTPHPQSATTLPHSLTIWGQSIQTHKPGRDISYSKHTVLPSVSGASQDCLMIQGCAQSNSSPLSSICSYAQAPSLDQFQTLDFLSIWCPAFILIPELRENRDPLCYLLLTRKITVSPTTARFEAYKSCEDCPESRTLSVLPSGLPGFLFRRASVSLSCILEQHG